MHSDLHDPVTAAQPTTTPPDPSATHDARGALINHIRSTSAKQPRAALRRALRPRLGPALAGVTVAAMVAVTATAVPGMLGDTDPSDGTIAGPAVGDGAVAAAPDASPLMLLAAEVTSIDAHGDATLLEQTHTFAEGPGFSGLHLYLDDGRYAFGDDTAILVDDLQRLLDGATDTTAAGAPLFADAFRDAASMSAEDAYDHVLAAWNAHLIDGPDVDAEHHDNRVWISTIDIAGFAAGDAQVKAGMLTVLSAIERATVESATIGGRDVYVVDYTEIGDYQEQLVLDAATGDPIRYEGGIGPDTADVTIDYDVSRVEVDELVDTAAESPAA